MLPFEHRQDAQKSSAEDTAHAVLQYFAVPFEKKDPRERPKKPHREIALTAQAPHDNRAPDQNPNS